MGWGRTLFLGDIGNRLDIADAERAIEVLREGLTRSGAADRAQDERLAELEEENSELKLYLATLTRLLVDRGVIDEAALAAVVDAVEGSAPGPSGR